MRVAVAGHVDGMFLVLVEHVICLTIPGLLVLFYVRVLGMLLGLMVLLILLRVAEKVVGLTLVIVICVSGGSHMTAIVKFVHGKGRTSVGQVPRHRDIGSSLGGLLNQLLNRRRLLLLGHNNWLGLLHLLPGLVGESHDGHDSSDISSHVLWLHWLR